MGQVNPDNIKAKKYKPILLAEQDGFLKKEKNVFIAVFLVFLIFDVAGELIVNEREFNYFFAAGFILSALSYVIIKLLKNRTSVLDDPGR